MSSGGGSGRTTSSPAPDHTEAAAAWRAAEVVRTAVRQAITAPDVEMVAEAATAEEALQLAPQIRPDVLLVDIDLPGMDGVGLVRELAPRLPETRIVMLTVSSADHHLLDAMRYGARGYLTKDLSPEALLRAVRSAYDGELAMPRGLAARLVHRLLAEGLTDREIAGSLTISPRTVETHVSSVLHKLGARNRAEAARRYHEPG